MKYSLKNEYKKLLNEERVSIETPDGFYDYEFDNIKSIDFKNLNFLDGNSQPINSEFRKEIVKSDVFTTYKDPTKGTAKFDLHKHDTLERAVRHDTPEISYIMQYVILKAIKNIVLYEKRAFKNACDSFVNSEPSEKILMSLVSVIKFLNEKYNDTANEYYELLDDTVSREYEKKDTEFKENTQIENYKTGIINNIIAYFDSIINSSDYKGVLDTFTMANIKKESAIGKAISLYFNKDLSDKDRNKTASMRDTIIAYDYMADATNALSLFYRGFSKLRSKTRAPIRANVKNITDITKILDAANEIEEFKTINNLNAKNRKGKGEFLCHMLFNTSNPSLSIEPDVTIPRVGNFSVKSMASSSARTGENLDATVLEKMISFFAQLGYDQIRSTSKLSLSDVSSIVNHFREKNTTIESSALDKLKESYEELKLAIITEHNAIGLFLHKKDGTIKLKMKEEDKAHGQINLDNVYLSDFKNNRWSFIISEDDKDISYENLLRSTYENNINENKIILNNKVLKEIYPHLFKKKLISEGGLAGHMMHPYEALDMTPRQIIDRIKEYSTSQKIIEKVDGQNLFFTVEEDGTLMFARNKEDMTHDDLVAKFTGHGAEKPFVEGGNAIKRGVEQWLQSAGPAAEMEIREIFHPDGETKSFINFEIMHPDKPNQIIYDEKYIVFHSIVDYVDGRKTIHSTNKGQRLEKIIRLMDSGISSAGFTLASNRTVNLNELTSVQIEDYVERVKEVALSLGISEDVTLGEGIENIIKQEIEGLGIDLDRETLKKIYDFVLYGEDRQGNKIKSRDFTSSLVKSDAAGLRSLNLTNAQEALKKVQRILSPFKDVFVDLGIDLLKGVKSAYMSDETNQKNIELLRDKLQTAIDDLTNYMNEKPENYWEPEVHRLRTHLDKVIDKDITDIVATTVEGGVYDYQGDLIKVTGGFAPLNQILGAAYRDKKGIFPIFKQKFMQQESNRRSLKGVFNLIF